MHSADPPGRNQEKGRGKVMVDRASDILFAAKTPIIIDTETTGLNKMDDKPFLVLIRTGDKSYALGVEDAVRWLNDNMPRAEFNVFHNAKFDIHMLINSGLKQAAIDASSVWCTMVNECLIDDRRKSYSLDSLCKERFGVRKSDEELVQWLSDNCGGKPDHKSQMKNIKKAPLDMVIKYGKGDVEMTGMLFMEQRKEIEKLNLHRVSSLEGDVLKALVSLERRGVPINMGKVNMLLGSFKEIRQSISDRISEMIGHPVNVRSGKQLEKAFIERGDDVEYNEETGNPSFSKESLAKMDNELSKCILKERMYGVLINTFLTRFGDYVYPDGRIRCDFNQTRTDDYGVITGRLSASKPNMTQIPHRNKETASQVRAVFEAPKGKKWISADWNQFEFRVAAHYSRDVDLMSEFNKNPDADFHQLVADMTGLDRDLAKRINLGLVFGMGQGKLAKNCGLPYSTRKEGNHKYYVAGPEAKRVFNEYHRKMPGFRGMLKRAEQVVVNRGYVKSIFGRRIHLPKNKAYKAGGYVFQSTSADLMKMKLVELESALRGTRTELILPVHDEFDFITDNDRDVKTIKEILEDIPQLKIPVRSEVNIDDNWWEASK